MADKNKHHARIEEEVEFADGKVRTVKPLTIKSLRKFISIIEGLDTNATAITDDMITKMVAAAKIVVEQTDKSIGDDDIEEALDMDVFNKLMTVAMGNRLLPNT